MMLLVSSALSTIYVSIVLHSSDTVYVHIFLYCSDSSVSIS